MCVRVCVGFVFQNTLKLSLKIVSMIKANDRRNRTPIGRYLDRDRRHIATSRATLFFFPIPFSFLADILLTVLRVSGVKRQARHTDRASETATAGQKSREGVGGNPRGQQCQQAIWFSCSSTPYVSGCLVDPHTPVDRGTVQKRS